MPQQQRSASQDSPVHQTKNSCIAILGCRQIDSTSGVTLFWHSGHAKLKRKPCKEQDAALSHLRIPRRSSEAHHPAVPQPVYSLATSFQQALLEARE